MSKRSVFTTVTPLPPGVSRELVRSFLGNHLSMIDLNPLVIERHPIDPPADCQPEERLCNWYSITDKYAQLPGGRVLRNFSYTAAFFDLPGALQTHYCEPMGVDIRSRWSVGGALPGEPRPRPEIGSKFPTTGLYLCEDVQLRCNLLMTSFVKKTLRKAHNVLIGRLVAAAAAAATGGSQGRGREAWRSAVSLAPVTGRASMTLPRHEQLSADPMNYNRARSSSDVRRLPLNTDDGHQRMGMPGHRGPHPRRAMPPSSPHSDMSGGSSVNDYGRDDPYNPLKQQRKQQQEPPHSRRPKMKLPALQTHLLGRRKQRPDPVPVPQVQLTLAETSAGSAATSVLYPTPLGPYVPAAIASTAGRHHWHQQHPPVLHQVPVRPVLWHWNSAATTTEDLRQSVEVLTLERSATEPFTPSGQLLLLPGDDKDRDHQQQRRQQVDDNDVDELKKEEEEEKQRRQASAIAIMRRPSDVRGTLPSQAGGPMRRTTMLIELAAGDEYAESGSGGAKAFWGDKSNPCQPTLNGPWQADLF